MALQTRNDFRVPRDVQRGSVPHDRTVRLLFRVRHRQSRWNPLPLSARTFLTSRTYSRDEGQVETSSGETRPVEVTTLKSGCDVKHCRHCRSDATPVPCTTDHGSSRRVLCRPYLTSLSFRLSSTLCPVSDRHSGSSDHWIRPSFGVPESIVVVEDLKGPRVPRNVSCSILSPRL